MGGGDHHHHAPYKVPDFSVYKVEDAPELIKLRDRLAKKGLTDPWLRNEVWRFHKNWPTPAQNWRRLLTRGLGIGSALTALTVGIDYLFFSKDHGHGHDGHDHH